MHLRPLPTLQPFPSLRFPVRDTWAAMAKGDSLVAGVVDLRLGQVLHTRRIVLGFFLGSWDRDPVPSLLVPPTLAAHCLVRRYSQCIVPPLISPPAFPVLAGPSWLPRPLPPSEGSIFPPPATARCGSKGGRKVSVRAMGASGPLSCGVTSHTNTETPPDRCAPRS